MRKNYLSLFILNLVALLSATRANSQCLGIDNGLAITCNNPVVTIHSYPLGTEPYDFQWYDGQGNPIGENESILEVTQPGNYSVEFSNADGCTTTAFTFVEDQSFPPIVTIVPAPTLCGDTTIVLLAQATGGNIGNLLFLWTYNGVPIGNGPVITGPGTGMYCVDVINPITGCVGNNCLFVQQPAYFAFNFIDVIPATCPTSNDGSASIEVAGGSPPFEYQWSNGFSSNSASGLNAGTYTVSVTDITGCTLVHSITIPSLLQAFAGPDVMIDCNTNSATLDGSASSSGTDITYLWTGPGGFISSNINPTVTLPGTYTLRVTDTVNDCFAEDEVAVLPILEVQIIQDRLNCDSIYLSQFQFQNFPPSAYGWTRPDGTQTTGYFLIADQTGYYQLEITNPSNGCAVSETFYIAVGDDACGTISGRVVHDNGNCTVEAADPGLYSWVVTATQGGQTYYAVTDIDGHYSMDVPPGAYDVTIQQLPSVAWGLCQSSYQAVLPNAGSSATVNIPVLALIDCPLMEVEVGTGLLRRCQNNNYNVSYCNNGTVEATDVSIVITLDPLMSFVASSIAPASVNGSVITYEVGDLAPGDCYAFSMTLYLSCNAVTGQTHCVEAHIYPDTICEPNNPEWSGASLALQSDCGNGDVVFTITNVGAGDMAQASQFIIIEDGVMLITMPDTVQLGSGEDYQVTLPANGSTYRMEVDQVPNHPGESYPSLAVEGCGQNAGGGFSTGFVTQFSPDDYDGFVDIDCRQNVASFDPNDKHAYPDGYGEEHYIRPNTPLEYTIRFQNTGTDTAFTVIIRDTLSELLDMATVHPGPSSHPYRLEIHNNRELAFVFDPIQLPDSTTNLEGSMGFVRYTVRPRADAPLESRIDNQAAIYFDYNAPVLTNTTFHHLGEGFLQVVDAVINTTLPEVDLSWMPNPARQTALLRISGAEIKGERKLFIYDVAGRVVSQQTFTANEVEWNCTSEPSGLYFYKVNAGGIWLGSGKLAVKR